MKLVNTKTKNTTLPVGICVRCKAENVKLFKDYNKCSACSLDIATIEVEQEYKISFIERFKNIFR